MQQAARAATPWWLRALRAGLKVHSDERAWRLGAEGEEAVGAQLAKLPDAWVVVHDLPLSSSGANLDHLVIGPAGIFALNTKNLTGRVWVGERAVMVNGDRHPYLHVSRSEARTTAQILGAAAGLEVSAHPVLVIMCHELTVRAQPPDVTVLTRRQLVKWLRARPAVLTPEEVQRIAAAARRADSWPTVEPLTPSH